MRIAVYHNLPSGGAKRALYEQVRRLSTRHDIDVYTLSSADSDFCDIRPYVGSHKVFEFDPSPHFRKPFGILDHGSRALDIARLSHLQAKIADQIDISSPDVVYVSPCRFTQSPAILRYLKSPSVYYCQEILRQQYEPNVHRSYSQLRGWRNLVNAINPLRHWYNAAVIRVDRESLLAASTVLVNSYFSRESVYRVYGVSSRVCYLGVDLAHFRPLQENREREAAVLSVGALFPNKGFDFLIQSLALIPQDRRPVLWLVTNSISAKEADYLEDLANTSHVCVEVHRGIDEASLRSRYSRAALVAYAPILEPFGLIALESMACGTPVVAVAEGGVRETVVDAVTGLLVDRDPAEMAEAIDKLLGDDRLAAELGANGRALVEARWSWDQSVQRLEDLLTDQAQRRRGKLV